MSIATACKTLRNNEKTEKRRHTKITLSVRKCSHAEWNWECRLSGFLSPVKQYNVVAWCLMSVLNWNEMSFVVIADDGCWAARGGFIEEYKTKSILKKGFHVVIQRRILSYF